MQVLTKNGFGYIYPSFHRCRVIGAALYVLSEIDHAIKDKECQHFPDHFKVVDEADPISEAESLTQLATKSVRRTQKLARL